MSAQNPLYRLGAFRLALQTARILPRRACRAIGITIARRHFKKPSPARQAIEQNLAQAFHLTGPELQRLAAANFENFGGMLADYFYSSVARPASINATLEEWRGWENLLAARAQGRGVILITAHLGNWELGGMLLALRGIPMTVVTLQEPTSELSRWREEYRQRLGIGTITVGGDPFAFVEMIAALRRNEVVAMLIDRPAAGSGAGVQFFGRETPFSTGPALLWQHTGAAVMPAFVLGTASERYLSFIDPPVPLEKSDDPRADVTSNTQRIATAFETIIRAHPEQWYNYVPLWPNDPAS